MAVHQPIRQNVQMEEYQRLMPLSAICQTLRHLLVPGFGPNGLKTLLASSTGQVLITNSGCLILKSLNIAHPFSKLITSTVLEFQNKTGDHSKSFIFLLAGLISQISTHVDFRLNCQDANIAARNSHRIAFHSLRTYVLPKVLLPELVTQFSAISICHKNTEAIFKVMNNLISTFLSSRYSPITSSHLADVLIELLASFSPDITCLKNAVVSCADLFQLLCVEVVGEHPMSSKTINGFLIQKDFLYSSPSLNSMQEIRFVIWHNSGDESEEETALPRVTVGSRADLVQALQWKTLVSRSFVRQLQNQSVTLLISSGQITDLMNGLCSASGISTIQFVSEEEIARILLMAKIHPVCDISNLGISDADGLIGIAQSCKTTILGGRHFIQLEGVRPVSLDVASHHSAEKFIVVYGPSMGVCQEIKADLHSSLKVILMWLSCDWLQTDKEKPDSSRGLSLPGGGTFEMLLYGSLRKLLLPGSKHRLSEAVRFACKALQQAVLDIPVSLLMNSYKSSSASAVAVLNLIETSLANSGRVEGIDSRTGERLHNGCIIEPVEGKVNLLLTVLSLIEQILGCEMSVSSGKVDNLCHSDSESEEE